MGALDFFIEWGRGMNSKQFKLMWIVIIVFVTISVVVPVRVPHDDDFEKPRPMLIFEADFSWDNIAVDLWIIEYVALAVLSVGFWITSSDKRQKKPPLPPSP
jgi:hypothetical protein